MNSHPSSVKETQPLPNDRSRSFVGFGLCAIVIVVVAIGGWAYATEGRFGFGGDREEVSSNEEIRSTPTSVPQRAKNSTSGQQSSAGQEQADRPPVSNSNQDEDPFVKSLDWLKTASAEEKDSLRRKRERFDRLPESEKDRLRDFHETLMVHPERQRLQQVLVRYDEWLRTLTPAKRAEIQDLPIDQRIAKIKEFQEEQARRALGFFGETKLPDQDIPCLYDWIDSYVAANEEMLLRQLPARKADEIRRRARSDDWRRRKIAYELTTLDLDELRDMVTVKDVETLLGSLSDEAHEILQTRSSSEDKALLVQRWIRFALVARNMYTMPKVSDEELEKFFREDLTEEEREQLDRMPPDQRKQRLEWLYRSRHSRRSAARSDGPNSNTRNIEYDLIDQWILLADGSQAVQFIDAFEAYNPETPSTSDDQVAANDSTAREANPQEFDLAPERSQAKDMSDGPAVNEVAEESRADEASSDHGLSSAAPQVTQTSPDDQSARGRECEKDRRDCDKEGDAKHCQHSSEAGQGGLDGEGGLDGAGGLDKQRGEHGLGAASPQPLNSVPWSSTPSSSIPASAGSSKATTPSATTPSATTPSAGAIGLP